MNTQDVGHTCMLSHFSHVWLFVTLRIIAHQAPLPMGFSRQKCWSMLSCLPPGDLPHQGKDQTPLSHVSCVGRCALHCWHHLGSPRNVAYPHNGLMSTPKRNDVLIHATWMNSENAGERKEGRHKWPHTVWLSIHEISTVRKPIEAESR